MSPTHSSEVANEEALVVAAKSGDRAAFVELRRRYSGIVLGTTGRITKNREDAEDAAQDCFLKAFLHLSKFEERCRFSTWLTRIAINSALMILRKKLSSVISIDGTSDNSEAIKRWDLPDPKEDPERCFLRNEREECLKGAIRRLRPALRDVVELQVAEEYSIKELAEVLNLSVTATKSRAGRAKSALRASLSARMFVSGDITAGGKRSADSRDSRPNNHHP